MKKTQKISVLLADDHQMLLDLWDFILTRDERFEVCGKAASGSTAVEMARTKRPDVVLMDINIGPIDGFEATRLIRNFSPLSKIIGVSLYVFPAYARKMKALGAMGYVTKGSPADETIKAILEVKKGNFYCCRQIEKIMKVEDQMYGNRNTMTAQLTQREIEIIQLIRNGLRSKDIARRLQLSPKTVNIHRNNIFKKLNVQNVASLLSTAQVIGI